SALHLDVSSLLLVAALPISGGLASRLVVQPRRVLHLAIVDHLSPAARIHLGEGRQVGGARGDLVCHSKRVWIPGPPTLRTTSSRSEEQTSELQSPAELLCRL